MAGAAPPQPWTGGQWTDSIYGHGLIERRRSDDDSNISPRSAATAYANGLRRRSRSAAVGGARLTGGVDGRWSADSRRVFGGWLVDGRVVGGRFAAGGG
jgi:hypothetical protein